MSLLDLLDRPIAYHRVFAEITGSVKAAILLSQALYWQKRTRRADGYWYKTYDEWEDETGLSRHELDTARGKCEKYILTDLRDAPARLYWKLNEDSLVADLVQFAEKRQTEIAENRQTGSRKIGKLVRGKSANIKRNAETTTETTTVKPKASQIPELVLYRDVCGMYPSQEVYESVKSQITKVAARLGRDVLCADLQPFRVAWVERGYNRFSINWMEWAVTGVVPPLPYQKGVQHAQRSTNNNGNHHGDDESARQAAERIKARRAANAAA